MSSGKFHGVGRPVRITTATNTSPADWQRNLVVERVVMNEATTGTLVLRDEANGTTSTPIFDFASGLAAGTVLELGCFMTNGLTVTTAGATVDITVIVSSDG